MASKTVRAPCSYPDGSTYEGNFTDSVQTGQGTKTWGDGSVLVGHKYVGEFKNNMLNGQGSYTYADGSVYTGSFTDNVKVGQGQKTG